MARRGRPKKDHMAAAEAELMTDIDFQSDVFDALGDSLDEYGDSDPDEMMEDWTDEAPDSIAHDDVAEYLGFSIDSIDASS